MNRFTEGLLHYAKQEKDFHNFVAEAQDMANEGYEKDQVADLILWKVEERYSETEFSELSDFAIDAVMEYLDQVEWNLVVKAILAEVDWPLTDEEAHGLRADEAYTRHREGQ